MSLRGHLGNYNTATSRTHVRFGFSTHEAAGANVEPSSAFEAADLRIYKATDGAALSATQRSSANGITMTSPFDSLTGVHAVDIDLSDNTDSGFFSPGCYYEVWLCPDETIDGQTIAGVCLCSFEVGVPAVNAVQISGSATAADNAEIVFDTDFATNYNTTEDRWAVATRRVWSTIDADYYDGLAINSDGEIVILGYNTILNRLPAALGPNGNIMADLCDINGTSIAGTSTQVAAAFLAQYNVATPVFTNASVIQTGDTYALANGASGFAATKTAVDAKASQVSVDDLPTNAELATALGTADDAVLAAIAALNNLSNAQLTAAIAAGDDATLAAIAALNNVSTTDVTTSVTTALTTALTEGYRATNATGSVRDLLYEINQGISEFVISSTTKTVKKIDGSTTAKTYTLNDASSPTGTTETT